ELRRVEVTDAHGLRFRARAPPLGQARGLDLRLEERAELRTRHALDPRTAIEAEHRGIRIAELERDERVLGPDGCRLGEIALRSVRAHVELVERARRPGGGRERVADPELDVDLDLAAGRDLELR